MRRIDDALRRARGEQPDQAVSDADIATPWQFAEGVAVRKRASLTAERRAASPSAPTSGVVAAVDNVTLLSASEATGTIRHAGLFVSLDGGEQTLQEQARRSQGEVPGARLVSAPDASPVLIEQFRNLSAALNRLQRERTLKSLLVTSPAPGDGKSHVAVNLALTLSESYRHKVLLVDADMRRPTLHRLFNVSGAHGLLNALRAETEEVPTVVPVTGTLSLLPAGRPQPNPVGDLSSGRMARLIASACSRFDWVIIDSPPAAGLADARIILETVDGAILVVRAGTTRFEELQVAADALGPDRVLGVVLNAVDPREINREDYYGKYYVDGTD